MLVDLSELEVVEDRQKMDKNNEVLLMLEVFELELGGLIVGRTE